MMNRRSNIHFPS